MEDIDPMVEDFNLQAADFDFRVEDSNPKVADFDFRVEDSNPKVADQASRKGRIIATAIYGQPGGSI